MVEKKDKNSKRQVQEENLDEALDDTFPASDPPAHSGVTGDRGPPKKPENAPKK
ncbi:hypothetical protein [Acetobacter orleanensis]|uniref:Uncharacterized protein n=1 Tax=Acetobacter orleanensis TaxID=104099 RepID=A0A4Y3TII5_9PROT|nr:hypothetical protein [Acetobacter orleanensis]GAN67962.1 hypothetical protein Abol_014_013 [Acetobacter orleanensis JCM 7639]GBR27511.1 hypothetical protein AA0473_1459 [Acetobacter orleanensis NRIC 0473]GEB82116.1 hypothetical protein AOR01nite_05930 [Acetobacter orleanensis]